MKRILLALILTASFSRAQTTTNAAPIDPVATMNTATTQLNTAATQLAAATATITTLKSQIAGQQAAATALANATVNNATAVSQNKAAVGP
jgi:hypothetical protein